MTCFNFCFIVFCAVSSGLLVVVVVVDAEGNSCSADIRTASKLPCPEGLTDRDGDCWTETYGRGAGRAPDLAPCKPGERDDGSSCWLDSRGRGAGRLPDKAPCPSGLRDDGTSCWSDAHIYGKGCCCTLWGCCGGCKSGYHDDGCTCRKTDVGIKVTLFQRQSCRSNEDKNGALCYPKCDQGYHPVGCCICEPDGGPRIVTHKVNRQSCREDEEHDAFTDSSILCYPKCKPGYRPVGCCICEPDESPRIKMTLFERSSCPDNFLTFLTLCLKVDDCPLQDVIGKITDFGVNLTPEDIEELERLLLNRGKLL